LFGLISRLLLGSLWHSFIRGTAVILVNYFQDFFALLLGLPEAALALAFANNALCLEVEHDRLEQEKQVDG